jgi:hypothetical protein
VSQKVRDIIQSSGGEIVRISTIPLENCHIVAAYDVAGNIVASKVLAPPEKEALEMMLGGRLS